MSWADKFRTLGVRTNADTPPTPAPRARFGAEGIGLCRTEHMFFDDERIVAVREMILADDSEGRRKALAKLLPMQRDDFIELFRDHERPAGHHPPARPAAARVPAARPTPRCRRWPTVTGKSLDEIRQSAVERCTRSTRCWAIAAAASASPSRRSTRCRCGRSSRPPPSVIKETGETVEPEIMIPLVATTKELDILKAMIDRVGARGRCKADGRQGALPGRHHDRDAARGAAWPTRSPRRRSSSPSAPTT